MGELTASVPKPMLKVAGKTLLEHKLDVLPREVDEVIIVVGYLGSVIHDYFGGIYGDRRILYVEQENPAGGTAEALWLASDLLADTFFVMNGDNIYAPQDMAACAKHEWAVLVEKREHVRTGAVITDSHGRIKSIAENTEHGGGPGFANTGFYFLDRRVFDYKPVPKAPGSDELGLPQTIVQAAEDLRIQAVPATYWIEIKEPADLERAERTLASLS